MRAWIFGVAVGLALSCAADPDDSEREWLDPRVVEPAWIDRPYSDVGLAPVAFDGRPLVLLVARVGARASFAFGHQLTVYDLDRGERVDRFDLTGPILGLWVVGDAVVGLARPGAPLAVPEGGPFAARAVVFRVGAEGLQTLEVEGEVRDAALVDGHLLVGVVEAPDGRIPFDEVESPAALLAVHGAWADGELVLLGDPAPVVDTWLPPDAHVAVRPVAPSAARRGDAAHRSAGGTVRPATASTSQRRSG